MVKKLTSFRDVAVDRQVTELVDGINAAKTTLDNIALTGEATGFPNRTATTLSFVDGTRTFTITGTNFSVYIKSQELVKNTESIAIPNTVGLHFIYYNAAGVLTTAMSFWDLSVTVPIATVYWNGSVGLVGDERHGMTMDWVTHGYLHMTVGSRYNTGLVGTFTNTTFAMTAGSFYDEDILIAIGAQTNCRVLYRAASGTSFTYTAAQAAYYTASTGVLDYDNAGTRTAVPSGSYVAYWLFATNDPTTPIYSLMGQRVDNNITNARNNSLYESLVLSNLPFAEMKLLCRVLVRHTGAAAAYVETQDMRNVYNLPSGTFVASSHSALTGLGADDHPQYLLVSAYTAADVLSKLTGVDGTGSGLDADKLDGNEATAFATSAQGALADAALPSSSYTASDVLTKIKTVDGSGTGLDADLLDGMQADSGATGSTIAARNSLGVLVGSDLYSHDGSVHSSSDSRLKDKHGDYSRGLAEILALNPYHFTYKQGNTKALRSDWPAVGLSAEDVQKVIPEAVAEDDDGFLNMTQGPIFYAMLNSIKELSARVEALEKEVAKLKPK